MEESRKSSLGAVLGIVGGVVGLISAFIIFGTSLVDRETANTNQATVDALEARLESLEEDSNEVQVRVEDVEGNVQIAVDQIDSVEATSSSLGDRLENVEEESDELRASLQALADGGAQPSERTTLALAGTWDGRYRCSQGITGLTLTIEEASEDSVLALFEFYPLPENSGVRSGSFVMSGAVSRQAIELSPDYWVERASGYAMVGLSLDLPSGVPPRLEGTVTVLSSCERVELVKTSEEGKEIPL